jgi:flagellar motor switch protein FliM
MSLVTLEQIFYAEFMQGFSSPTFIADIGLYPYDDGAVIEISPALVFTFVEMLLDGSAANPLNPRRKFSEIEKSLMKNLLRILLQDLGEAWKGVTDIRFSLQSLVDEPQTLHVLAPGRRGRVCDRREGWADRGIDQFRDSFYLHRAAAAHVREAAPSRSGRSRI